ncbi:MAG: hypothetical protein ABSB73_05265 [Solirubrobacteraceae bacterium]
MAVLPVLVGAAVTVAATFPAQGQARAAAARAARSASGRVFELPFSGPCASGRTPHVLGAVAQVTVPASWRTVTVPPYQCAQPYLLTDRRGDAGLCVQQTVYATMAPGGGAETPAAFLGHGYTVLARGRLPTISGMRGVWEELDVGMRGSPSYGVNAAYEAANRDVFYELLVEAPFPAQGCPASSGPQARGIARQLASSFRVLVTHPATAETYG